MPLSSTTADASSTPQAILQAMGSLLRAAEAAYSRQQQEALEAKRQLTLALERERALRDRLAEAEQSLISAVRVGCLLAAAGGGAAAGSEAASSSFAEPPRDPLTPPLGGMDSSFSVAAGGMPAETPPLVVPAVAAQSGGGGCIAPPPLHSPSPEEVTGPPPAWAALTQLPAATTAVSAAAEPGSSGCGLSLMFKRTARGTHTSASGGYWVSTPASRARGSQALRVSGGGAASPPQPFPAAGASGSGDSSEAVPTRPAAGSRAGPQQPEARHAPLDVAYGVVDETDLGGEDAATTAVCFGSLHRFTAAEAPVEPPAAQKPQQQERGALAAGASGGAGGPRRIAVRAGTSHPRRLPQEEWPPSPPLSPHGLAAAAASAPSTPMSPHGLAAAGAQGVPMSPLSPHGLAAATASVAGSPGFTTPRGGGNGVSGGSRQPFARTPQPQTPQPASPSWRGARRGIRARALGFGDGDGADDEAEEAEGDSPWTQQQSSSAGRGSPSSSGGSGAAGGGSQSRPPSITPGGDSRVPGSAW